MTEYNWTTVKEYMIGDRKVRIAKTTVTQFPYRVTFDDFHVMGSIFETLEKAEAHAAEWCKPKRLRDVRIWSRDLKEIRAKLNDMIEQGRFYETLDNLNGNLSPRTLIKIVDDDHYRPSNPTIDKLCKALEITPEIVGPQPYRGW